MGNINGKRGICDYHGCGQPLAPDQSETGMQFCKVHDDEVMALVNAAKGPALVKFWIKAQGGATLAARRMMSPEK